MRAIWKGAISFGLVNIPVGLYPASKPGNEIKFQWVRARDQSPIKNKRVAEADGQEVPWEEVAKVFKYDKEHFVTLNPVDFDRVKLPSSQAIDIREFVDLKDIDPMYFEQPYYIGPSKGGSKAYAILRDALKRTEKVGIAKVVLKPPREHLAAVRPLGDALVLELMHFPDELTNVEDLKLPTPKAVGQSELALAEKLVHEMSNQWEPSKYKDDYSAALLEVIQQKIEAGGKELPAPPLPRKAAKAIVDLVDVLQQSVQEVQEARKKPAK